MSFERCRKCEKRLPACQDSCEHYKAEKERIAEKKNVIESNKRHSGKEETTSTSITTE